MRACIFVYIYIYVCTYVCIMYEWFENVDQERRDNA
jgi:hypothetical protein